VALDEGKTQPPTDTSRKGVEVALPSSKAILSLPLIPVRLPKLKSQGAKVAAGTKKLQPLEPQTLSPGPRDQPHAGIRKQRSYCRR